MLKTVKIKKIQRLLVVLLMLAAGFFPLFRFSLASAYTTPSQRYIKLSSSRGTQTDVTYAVGYTTNQGGVASNIGGVVIDFCDESPIIGDVCTTPVGFNINEAGLALANQSGITDFQIESETDTNTLVLSRTGGATSVNQNVAITVDLGAGGASDGVTNPTAVNTTFYARILTFATQVGAEEYESEDIDDADDNTGIAGNGPHVVVDAGGIALSTAEQITITAKVQERLTFCVFITDGAPADTCGTGTTGNAIILGNDKGVLDDGGAFVDISSNFTVQTNALYGVAIRMKGSTLKTSPACAETTGQNCNIDAIGSTAVVSSPGDEQFGMCLDATSGPGAAGLTPAAPYDDPNCNPVTNVTLTQTAGTATPGGDGGALFAYNNSNTNDLGTTSLYGAIIANKVAGAFSTATLAFIGNIDVTTEPGIYTTTLTFIATGTF